MCVHIIVSQHRDNFGGECLFEILDHLLLSRSNLFLASQVKIITILKRRGLVRFNGVCLSTCIYERGTYMTNGITCVNNKVCIGSLLLQELKCGINLYR